MAGNQSLPYSSPETGSSHWLEPPSGGIATARWETQLSAAAPCQSLPSGGCPPRLRGGVPGRVRPGLGPAAPAGGQQDLVSLVVVDVPAVPAARLKGHIGDGRPCQSGVRPGLAGEVGAEGFGQLAAHGEYAGIVRLGHRLGLALFALMHWGRLGITPVRRPG